MPHPGLVETIEQTEAEVALMRARLHLKRGKRHLQKGLIAAGIAALYDALLFGMRYFIAGPGHHKGLSFSPSDLWDHAALYHRLTKIGIFDDPRAFNQLSLIVERALWQGSYSYDGDSVLADVEDMLTRLGVIPFNDSALPNGF